jgi:hypothetical protein
VSEDTNLHGWNADISKIPVGREVFALLTDKLRPSVIIPRYREAKHITWTEAQEGTVLTYDCPEGNFHACNGNAIKYWKDVNPPSSNVVVVADVVETIKSIDIRKEYKEFLLSLINRDAEGV